jgi:hypothetical protein
VFGQSTDKIQKRIKFPVCPPSHAIKKSKKKFDQGAKQSADSNTPALTPDLMPGDLVLLRVETTSSAIKEETKKMHLLYQGPFLVKKVLHVDTFVLESLDSKMERGVFNRRHLKKFVSRT